MSHLHRAARRGDLDDVLVCLAEDDYVHAISVHGFSPLMLAAREGHVSVVEALISAGARLDAASHKNGRTPLDFAAGAGYLLVVERLIAAGARVDGIDVGKGTPLITAAQLGHKEVAAFLIAHGADPTRRDRWGKTAGELLASGGVFGESKEREREMAAKRATGWRPKADERSETIVHGFIAEYPSADEYAAKHGRTTLVWGFGRDQFADAGTDRWVQRVSQILFTPSLLDECEERYLIGEELQDARKRRARHEKRRARKLKP